MTRRRLWQGGGVLALLSGLGALLWMSTQPSGIGRLSCLHIRAGMSLAEVEAVVGLPPGDYRAEPAAICESWLHRPGETHSDWYTDDGHLRIVFDARHRVVACEWSPDRPTALDLALHRLGW